MEASQKKENLELPYDSAKLLLGLQGKESKSANHRSTIPHVAKAWSQPGHLPTGEWVRKYDVNVCVDGVFFCLEEFCHFEDNG